MMKSFLAGGLAIVMAAPAMAATTFNVNLTAPASSPSVNRLLLTLSVFGTSGSAFTNLSLDASNNPVSAQIDINGGAFVPGSLTTADVTALTVPATAFDLSNTSLVISIPFLANLSASLVGVGATLQPGDTYPVSGGVIDLGGKTISLDQGLINYNVTGFINTSGAFNLNTAPLNANLPLPTPANVSLAYLAGQNYQATLSVPVNVTSGIDLGGLTSVFVTLTGNITLQGTVTVPEANSLVLLGIAGAGVGFAAVRRRRNA